MHVKSYLDKKFNPPAQTAAAQSSMHIDESNISGESSEDTLEFSRSQVLLIVDSTIDWFVEKVAGDAFSASNLSEVANSVKESLPITEDDGADKPAFTRTHVRKLMGTIARGCQRTLQHPEHDHTMPEAE